MGFKKLNLEELESLLTPSLIGPPVTHIQELDLLSAEDEEISEKSSLSISSELTINNIETLEYGYDKDRKLEKFDSTGSFLVSNQSKKDRVWDVRLILENNQNTNIDENQINLGSFEPETNKKISYNLINREKLAKPLVVDEKIEVMRINSENIKNLQSLLKEEQHKILESNENKKHEEILDEEDKEVDSSLIKEDSKKKSLKDIKKADPRKEKINEIKNEMAQLKEDRKKEIIENYNSKIDEVQNHINNELEKIEEINSNFEKWKNHKGNYQEVVRDLSNKLKSVEKEKKNQISSKVSELESKRDKEIENIAETDEEKKEIVTKKIEEEFEKEKKSEISSIDKKYAPKIQEIKQKLDEEQNNLEHSSGKFSTFKSKKKDTEKKIKKLEKTKSKLIKKKSKTLKKQIKKLSKKEKKRIKNVNEFGEEIQKPSIIERIKTVFKALFKSGKESKKETQKEEKEKKEEPEIIEQKENEYNLGSPEIESPVEESQEDIPEVEIFNQPRLVLLYNQKNTVKFTITLENVTENIMTNIEFAKAFSDEFYNFTYDKRKFRNIDINKNRLFLEISELKPNSKVELIIFADINPDQKRVMRSGEIQVSYRLVNNVISKIKLDDAAGYSHVMHAINVKEKETEPNLWKCALIFKNNSDFDIKLNSILVTNREKDKNFINIEFDDHEKSKIIGSGEKYISEEWELKTPKEPKFLRKLDYTITYKIEKETRINLKYADNIFNIIDIALEKRFDITQIKSFEEAEITNFVNIKNIGTTGVKGLYIKEMIPADFIPSLDIEDYNIRTSSGIIKSNNFRLNILPYDENPEKEHSVEILVNIDEERNNLLEIDDFIELTYTIKAITPQYKKYYEFSLEVFSYYPKFSEDQIEEIDEVYSVYKKLDADRLPSLEIVHKRRNLLIGKEIFPGRTTEEFGISIIVKNNSNVEIKDIKIKDTISNAFKIISSNVDYEFEDDKELGTISFLIESILSYQEKEIRYYVKKKSGEKIDYAELESYIFG